MAQPVYKNWFARYTEAWYKLTPDEQNALMAANEASIQKVGGESLIFCFSVSDEEWNGWGVEKYPSFEALQQRQLDLFAMNWSKYFDAKSYLGVDLPQG